MSSNPPDDAPPSSRPPASARIFRVRRGGAGWVVVAGESVVSEELPTRDDAMREARLLAGDVGALVLVEGESGHVEAEVIHPK